jgi:hypothetical protein
MVFVYQEYRKLLGSGFFYGKTLYFFDEKQQNAPSILYAQGWNAILYIFLLLFSEEIP